MAVEQIYELVNEVALQSMGENAVDVIDTSTLVALGDTVLSSNTNCENFLKTLVQKIGRTIISYRKYSNNLAPIMMSDMEWGAIVQKVKVNMPTVSEDDSFELEDDGSIDMYKIKKPTARQSLFYNKTAYSCFVTIQEHQLREAFLGPTEMGSFIAAIFGEIQNYLELATENLSKLTLNNFICSTDATQRINLVSNYNALLLGDTVTADNALYNERFLRYALGQIKTYMKRMQSITTLYNAEGEKRFTPAKDQIFTVLTDFQTAMETQVEYAAFNSDLVKLRSTLSVPYWQGIDEPMGIHLTTKRNGTVQFDNIVGVLFDRNALGTYRKESQVLTTPMNARGRYTNTFWHEEQMWFNDMSENGIVFMLN